MTGIHSAYVVVEVMLPYDFEAHYRTREGKLLDSGLFHGGW